MWGSNNNNNKTTSFISNSAEKTLCRSKICNGRSQLHHVRKCKHVCRWLCRKCFQTVFWQLCFTECWSAMSPSLPLSHSAVVCGGWHPALRLSCLPPPLFSALQWDHVVLLISQQWPYSLPFPLFSLTLSLHILIPLVFVASPRRHLQQATCNFSPAVRLTLFTLLWCHSFPHFFHSTQSFSTSRHQLTQLFGALAVAR